MGGLKFKMGHVT